MICLIPHSTHALQPLDVSVFKSAKVAWRQIVSEYYSTSGFKLIDKATFPILLKKIYETAFLPQHAVAGFYKSGLYPLDRSKPDAKVETAEVFDEPVSSSPLQDQSPPQLNSSP